MEAKQGIIYNNCIYGSLYTDDLSNVSFSNPRPLLAEQ